MSRVAICIPTYNQAIYLEAAIRSALAQTIPCEVWVSDDASTDETPQIGARLQTEFPQLRWHRNPANLGIAANNNLLLRHPQTDFVIRLDSDDLLEVDYAAVMVAALEASPKSGYAHCAIREIDHLGTVTRIRRLAGRGRFRLAEGALKAAVSGYRVAANVCTFRKSVLDQCHYYREGMNFAEDWDLSVRIADAGWGNSYLDEPFARYRWWFDAGGRLRRKRSEIEGCLRVFEQSLEPAFITRGWDVSELIEARRKFALNHADVLVSSQFTAEEKAELVRLLHMLGGGPELQRRIRFLQSPLGFLVPFKKKIRTWCADQIKAVLSSLRK